MKIEIIDEIRVRVTNHKGDTFVLQDNEGFYTDFFKQENNQPLTLYVVSSSCADKEQIAYEKGWEDGAKVGADDISSRV